MSQEPGAVEQAVSRALRDNLGSVQRTAEDLRHAVDDFVSACSSSKPANALPAMVRAQTAAASLAAALDVLARFVAATLQPPKPTPVEEALLRAVGVSAPAPAPEIPPPAIPTSMAAPPAPAVEAAAPVVEVAPPPPPVIEAPPPPPVPEPEPEVVAEAPVEAPPPPEVAPPPPPEEPVVEEAVFDVKSLSFEEQELHRKANRHAKVAMQDIKMYKKAEVKLAQENKDICVRLRDDLDKARKEYDRRFRGIATHPVDYFYDWMVQILADGDPEKLGEYPYPSPVKR